MAGTRSLHRVFYWFFILLIAASPLGYAGPAVARPGVYRYANNVSLAAGSPLPIYKITSPVVTQKSIQTLAQVFSGIDDASSPKLDTYLGHSRFTRLNEKNHTILEQYGATGGFYAFDPERAFGDGSVVPNPNLNPAQAQLQACQFILLNQATLAPVSDDLQIPGLDVSCRHSFDKVPLYKVSTETRSGQGNTVGAITTNTPLRIMVTLPVLVNTGLHSQIPSLPFAGPGGHISMIFNDTSLSQNGPAPSLDSDIVGLQAVAMPAFGRSLTFSRTAPAADPDAAVSLVIQQVKTAFPGGTNIHIPGPDLAYFVTDAAQPQTVLEPVLIFSGVTVDVDGQTQILKDIVLPGVVSGPGPKVTILSPLDGAVHFSGKTINLKGQIGEGKPPYSYDWQFDGLSLGGGILIAPGTTPALAINVPNPESKGDPADLTVHLVVTDSEGVTRQQSVSLVSPAPFYLPVVLGGSAGSSTASAGQKAEPTPAEIVPMAINYRFGVEYGSDYPPYGAGGSDLGGVPPDANGLSAGLMGLGWPRSFNWYNANAWERDWRDCSLGGGDCTYGVDRVDYVYYSGHGGAGGLAIPSNSHDFGLVRRLERTLPDGTLGQLLLLPDAARAVGCGRRRADPPLVQRLPGRAPADGL